MHRTNIFFLFYFGCMGILAPWGWNPSPQQWKYSFNHWTAREVPTNILKVHIVCQVSAARHWGEGIPGLIGQCHTLKTCIV